VLGVRTGAHFVSVSTICFRFDIGNAPSLFWEENCNLLLLLFFLSLAVFGFIFNKLSFK
jgi:hypothetical protein